MKIGLIGFGKAGKAVANVILRSDQHSLEWVLRNSAANTSTAKDFLEVDSPDPAEIVSLAHQTVRQLLNERPVDAIIDFSGAEGIYQYGKEAAVRKITIISAISHYGEAEKKFLEELSLETAVFWSPNITLGVNYLLFAASLLKNIAPDVDIEISEEHFKAKAGVSGTAVKIAESLDVEADSINSVRAGGIVGRHEVIFGFPYQTVRLVHESISREAFGSGALFVAENLVNKPTGFYNFEDLLRPYFFSTSKEESS
ncbi:4-hydroxy-tetrahydrodipicolinate reductase [Chryseobacterium sp.]|uniref:4-hydroxy-tetrahydrodipicolinate reductase n=1 Tax=Chryseobacterium sp. TaxID=1871047 RepID=UPI0011CB68A8|nr:dihydrodipicolinate reductase C-terminal domain-containing protein [Chryseobacterium sp.]TXF79472.1 dihydrodipicolinate reductase [Chryseobacterium sp.]